MGQEDSTLRLVSFAQPWIPREMQHGVVMNLLHRRLLKFDNNRSLPLKMGGTTDVYVNLRDARNNPDSILEVAEMFAEPLRQLRVDRFVEVPDSVSCFAGPLALELMRPYLTIRDEAKEGRVANARVIGRAEPKEKVAIIDDVITDGASKIGPFKQCREMKLDVQALVVLVDRQQGWLKKFEQEGINFALPVWAGMTLHDVRRELIRSGEMIRCDEGLEKKNPIIVALDGKSWEEILPVVDRLRTTGCILKVNDLVFAEGMDHLLPELSVYGRVMVDLKCHDIPNTVENTCKRLAKHRPWAVTVHASGAGDMVKAAKKALEGTDTKVLAVTVLTSLDPDVCMGVYGRPPEKAVQALAASAFLAGADGVVCSPQEVQLLKGSYPDKLFVTPGIRSEGVSANDQARISTPKGAMDNGSTHLVMGRQILGAQDPVAEVNRVLTEELGL